MDLRWLCVAAIVIPLDDDLAVLVAARRDGDDREIYTFLKDRFEQLVM